MIEQIAADEVIDRAYDWLCKRRKKLSSNNGILAQLKVEKHPDKTFIGKAVRGFSFLSYFLKPGNLRVASTTISNMKECIARLYEQGACAARIGQYILRWVQWLLGGLADCNFYTTLLVLCSRRILRDTAVLKNFFIFSYLF